MTSISTSIFSTVISKCKGKLSNISFERPLLKTNLKHLNNIFESHIKYKTTADFSMNVYSVAYHVCVSVILNMQTAAFVFISGKLWCAEALFICRVLEILFSFNWIHTQGRTHKGRLQRNTFHVVTLKLIQMLYQQKKNAKWKIQSNLWTHCLSLFCKPFVLAMN